MSNTPPHLPHYVYRIFDRDDVLLYVGSTGLLDNRLRGHRRASAWFVLAERFTVQEEPDRATARAVELRALVDESPLFAWVTDLVRKREQKTRARAYLRARGRDDLIWPAVDEPRSQRALPTSSRRDEPLPRSA